MKVSNSFVNPMKATYHVQLGSEIIGPIFEAQTKEVVDLTEGISACDHAFGYEETGLSSTSYTADSEHGAGRCSFSGEPHCHHLR